MQFLCILLALLFVSGAEARVMMVRAPNPTLEEVAKTFPPEMLYDGKPIDPFCVDASNPTEGDAEPVDLKTCAHPPEYAKVMRGLQIGADSTLGYDFECTENGSGEPHYCGHVGYRYLGKVKDGFILQTNVNNGGTGAFTSIVSAKREGDTFSTEVIHLMGDRCNDGVVSAQVVGGRLEYGYKQTASQLYGQYKTSGGFEGYADSPLDCIAVIHKIDENIDSIELIRTEEQLKNDPVCAADAYREQVKANKSLSEDQVKAFFAALENKCQGAQ